MPATGNFVIRWTDSKGSKQRKVYSDRKLANQALVWLLQNGADDADIAVEFKDIPKEVDENS